MSEREAGGNAEATGLLRARRADSAAALPVRAFRVPGIIAASPSMLSVLEQLLKAARFDVPIHIGGESGTGKELAARAVHEHSPRSNGKLVIVNCAAIPDALLEAELFGHVRGAFTGAERSRPGLVEEAHGGTLFLDEVGDLSPKGQTLLLRVLQDKIYRRLGEADLRRSNFRLLSATHKLLEREVAEGRFRQDLFFRLQVVNVRLPALRERPADILPLARHYLGRTARQLGLPRPALAPEAEEALVAYEWPGNVRELENEMVQALLRMCGETRLGIEHLSPRLARVDASTLASASRAFERRYLDAMLARFGGNRSRTARALGLSRQALYAKLKKHGLSDRHPPGSPAEAMPAGNAPHSSGVSLAWRGAESQH